MKYTIPDTQTAVQLVGADELRLNESKEVFRPGAHQILVKVEAVGLCFSDLKLLKQFTDHIRKSAVVSGIEAEVLAEIPSYVPNEAPTVLGHEVVVRIAAVGEAVQSVKVGGRYLVQTDYRWLRTATSNAAFGYNFEGALQEYVLMDERVITSPEGESLLLAASEDLSAASIALAEPWACVEQAYAATERTSLTPGGKLLVVVEAAMDEAKLEMFLAGQPQPAKIEKKSLQSTVFSPQSGGKESGQWSVVSGQEEGDYDDVIYFGSNVETVESLFGRVANNALINIVLCGGQLAREAVLPVGKVHYQGIRIVGTTGSDPADSMQVIPATGEFREGDVIDVVGAGGPMGVMHVVRGLCQGVAGVKVLGGDLDDRRLEELERIARGPAEKNGVPFQSYNPSKEQPEEKGTYIVIMVPAPKLVAGAVQNGAAGAIINIFAGIPATVEGPVDLQSYIEKGMYFIGTSGSSLEDMKTMLAKVQSGQIDTNVSVAAIGSLDGAIEGIRAIEKQLVPGKILIYPACKGLGLVPLEGLATEMPEVASMLVDGMWTLEAEQKLLELYS
jgi:L-sorbose 1-phosphate reductase